MEDPFCLISLINLALFESHLQFDWKIINYIDHAEKYERKIVYIVKDRWSLIRT